jgi:hypothetical protein
MHDYPDVDPAPDLVIDGPRDWLRPAVALVAHDDLGAARTPRVRRAWLRWDVIVVDECGLSYSADDYLQELMGDLRWDCSTDIYQPHIDGPISDAPRIRRGTPIPPSVNGVTN